MDRIKTSHTPLCIALTILALVPPSAAVLAQVPLSADTFSFSQTPKKSYGNYPLMVVQQGASSYLQFDLAAIPTEVTVNKATLHLFVDSVANIKAALFDVERENAYSR